MVLHQTLQRLLLVGIRLHVLPAAPTPSPPIRLSALIAALAPAHHAFDELAVHFGHRYRSGFWAIYMLSAIAVLFAILPLALGWDDRSHALHPFAGLWAVAEVCVICIVSSIYWQGRRKDWQGEWLRTRTTAELTWYLPLLAPLVDFASSGVDASWYLRVFDPNKHVNGTDDIAKLCALHEPLARNSLEQAWSDPDFVQHYARWTMEVLEEQRRYHLGVAAKQHALLHRVHGLTSWLFGLTALGALTHLILHTLWLSLITTFFPALGASLHGAAAQSEAYRLSTTSERLVREIQSAVDSIRISLRAEPAKIAAAVKGSVVDALAVILEEHQDWQMLVRPHDLSLV